jgi:putative membrane protein
LPSAGARFLPTIITATGFRAVVDRSRPSRRRLRAKARHPDADRDRAEMAWRLVDGVEPAWSSDLPALGEGTRAARAVMLRAMTILLRWLLLAAALLLVANIYPGVQVASFGAAMIAALVIGLFNALVRPILVLLTLPVTVLTLGLFLFVINALMFYFAAGMLEGFHVDGFVAALIGSLLYSLCGLVIDAAMQRLFARR